MADKIKYFDTSRYEMKDMGQVVDSYDYSSKR